MTGDAVEAMHTCALVERFGANITKGAHLNSLWIISNHSFALKAGSSVLSLLERSVFWGNRENSKAISTNPGVGRFWIGAGSLVLGDSASGNFQVAGTAPPRVYTTGREIEDELGLRANLANPWCSPMNAPGGGVNIIDTKKGFLGRAWVGKEGMVAEAEHGIGMVKEREIGRGGNGSGNGSGDGNGISIEAGKKDRTDR